MINWTSSNFLRNWSWPIFLLCTFLVLTMLLYVFFSILIFFIQQSHIFHNFLALYFKWSSNVGNMVDNITLYVIAVYTFPLLYLLSSWRFFFLYPLKLMFCHFLSPFISCIPSGYWLAGPFWSFSAFHPLPLCSRPCRGQLCRPHLPFHLRESILPEVCVLQHAEGSARKREHKELKCVPFIPICIQHLEHRYVNWFFSSRMWLFFLQIYLYSMKLLTNWLRIT